MDAVCKFNKYGHCRYEKFCHFSHEDRKCEDKFCDIRLCSLRHPKNCKYVVKNKPCKFGEFCSFEHEIDDIATFLRDTPEKILEKKIQELHVMIGTKDSEIEYLKKIINKSNIGQFDGETYDDDPSDFLATDENENNVNDSDDFKPNIEED